MNQRQKRNPMAQYSQVAVGSELASASPHRLVELLMEGALDKIAIAKGAIHRNDLGEKSRHIGWAISIVNGLKQSLDFERGGAIAENLNDLYDYMTRRLVEANGHDDSGLLDEVASLMGEIKSAWSALPDEVKRVPAVPRESVG